MSTRPNKHLSLCGPRCVFPAAIVLVLLAATAQPLCAAGPGVQGQVFALDEQGKLTGIVPGAKIELKGQGGQVAASVTSDAQGCYKADLPPGTYFYSVRADGFKDENVGRGIQLKLTEGYTIYNFSLTKGKTDPDKKPPQPPVVPTGKLQGRVMEKTDDGRLLGIPGATVALRSATGGRRLTKVITRPGSPESQATGQYEIALAAGSWRASASAPGYETFVDPKPIEIQGGQTETRDFVLTRKASPVATDQGIKGTVRIRDPKRSAGTLPPVNISIVPLAASGTPATNPTADSQGKYSQQLRPGGYQVVAEAQGYQPARSGPKAVFPTKFTVVDLVLVPITAPGKEPPVEKPAMPPARDLVFEGTVFGKTGDDVMAKRPLPGATVLVRRQGEALSRAVQGTTDAQGKVRLKLPAPGSYQAMARMPGYAPSGLMVTVRESGDNRGEFLLERPGASEMPAVTPGVIAKPSVVPPDMPSTATLRVQVVDEAYRAIPDAMVAVLRRGQPHAWTQTGPSGSAGLSLPRDNFALTVSKPGYRAHQEAVNLARGDALVRVVLTRAEVPAVVPGVVTKPPVEPGVMPKPPVEPGDVPSTATLRVQVFDETRRALPDAMIVVLRNIQPLAHAQTGPAGSASLNLPRGNFRLTVSKRGYLPHREEVSLTRGDALVRVVLVRADRTPVEPGGITKPSFGPGEMAKPSVTPGGIEKPFIPGGFIAKPLIPPERGGGPKPPIPDTGTVKPQRPIPETGVAKPLPVTPAVLTLFVMGRNAGGPAKPLAGALVQVFDVQNRPVGSAQTDAVGRGTVRLVPGAYRVRVAKLGYPPADRTIQVGPKDSRETVVLESDIR